MRGSNDMDVREVVISVKNVKKSFKSYQDKAVSFKERFINPSRTKHENVEVLKGISFTVHRGEAVGLIGKNGCGKSTTLKMLTRIMYPNEGTIEIKGRVSSLIELGAGFHPDMTGRENIYTNASIFGITRKDVDKRLGDIIRFSELEDYIDNPVRTYSSGMYMRLAFAVAIHVDADVLLIDEILAVGDSAFQKKCFEKLKEIKANGTTIVIVSHSMEQMYKICDKLIWIENGLVREEGMPQFVGEEYLAAMEGRRLDRIELENQQKKAELEKKIKEEQERLKKERERLRKEEEERKKKERKRLAELKIPAFCRKGAVREGNMEIQFTDAVIFNSKGEPATFLETCEKIQIKFRYKAVIIGKSINISINITRDDGVYCYGTTTLSGLRGRCEFLSKSEGQVILTIEKLNLLHGKYLVDIGIQGTEDDTRYDYIRNALEFCVGENRAQQGIVHMERSWSVDGEKLEFEGAYKI